MTFGGGVKEIVSIFAPDFRPKMTSRLLVFWPEDARPDVAYQETLFLETTFEIRFQDKQSTVCTAQIENIVLHSGELSQNEGELRRTVSNLINR